jgi:Zn ribbon nucleic-acid-binding protein
MDITIYLMDIDADTGFPFTEWDGTRSNAEARMASARTITLTLTEDTHETVTDTLERVYAAANGMPNLIDVAVRDAYYSHEVRSLSVGDIVHVPGEGLFAVANMGFTRMHLHLPSDDREGFKGVTVSRGIRFRAVCPMCSEHVESADTWHLDIGHGVIECDACGWQHPAEAKDVDAYMAALAVAATARDAARAAELRGEDAAQSREWNRAEDGRDGYEADVAAERAAFIAEDRASQAADADRFDSEGA